MDVHSHEMVRVGSGAGTKSKLRDGKLHAHHLIGAL